MTFQTNSVDKNGLARTSDGKLYVTLQGSVAGSAAGATGFATVLAQSFAAVSAPADTTEDTLATITVPANALGANGCLRITTYWSWTNNANAKTPRIRFSGASGTVLLAPSLSTTGDAWFITEIFNAGVTNAQIGRSMGIIGSSSSSIGSARTTASVDTTASTSIVITGQKATGSDTLTLDGYTVEVIKP